MKIISAVNKNNFLVYYFHGSKHVYRRILYRPESRPTATLLWAITGLGLDSDADWRWDWLFKGRACEGYTATEAMLMVGKRLIELKTSLSYQDFEGLVKKIPMSLTTARSYMKCAEYFSDLPFHVDFVIKNTSMKTLQKLAEEQLSKEDLLILLKELV